MKAYEWKLDPSYEALCVVDRFEADEFLNRIGDLYREEDFCSGNDCYFLVNADRNYFSLPPNLNYLFQYDGKPPFGQEIEMPDLDFSKLKYKSFARIELPKRPEMLGVFIGDVASSRFKYRHIPSDLHIVDVFDMASASSGTSLIYLSALQTLSSQLKYQYRDLNKKDIEELQDQFRNLLSYYGRLYGSKGYCDALIRWIYANSKRRLEDDNLQLALVAVAPGWIAKTQDVAGKLAEYLCAAISDNEEVIETASLIARILYLLRNNREDEVKALKAGLEARDDKVQALNDMLKALNLVLEASSFNDVITQAILTDDQPSLIVLAAALAEAKFKASRFTKNKTIQHLSNPLVNDIYEVFLNIDNIQERARRLAAEN